MGHLDPNSFINRAPDSTEGKNSEEKEFERGSYDLIHLAYSNRSSSPLGPVSPKSKKNRGCGWEKTVQGDRGMHTSDSHSYSIPAASTPSV